MLEKLSRDIEVIKKKSLNFERMKTLWDKQSSGWDIEVQTLKKIAFVNLKTQ